MTGAGVCHDKPTKGALGMNLSEQILNKEFVKKLWGYDEAMVDEYLKQIAAYLDNLNVENRDLREKLKTTADQLAYMKNLENTLRDTLITAQKSAEETTRNATFRAEGIISTANEQARRILQQAEDDIVAQRKELDELRRQASIYRSNFKMLMHAQLQIMEDSGIGKEPAEQDTNVPRRKTLKDEPLDAIRKEKQRDEDESE